MKMFFRGICLFVFVNIAFVQSEYEVTLVSDSPIVKGANVTVTATLYEDDDLASGPTKYIWTDNGIPTNIREVVVDGPHDVWMIDYNNTVYPQGPYVVQLTVQKEYIGFFWATVTSNRIIIIITETLNGKLSLQQLNVTRDNDYVSTKEIVEHDIILKKSDADYLEKATSLKTFWFVDCIYYGFTDNLTYNYIYSEPEKHHTVEALVVADFTPLPPSTTTTSSSPPTTTTSISPNATTSSKPTPAPLGSTSVPHDVTVDVDSRPPLTSTPPTVAPNTTLIHVTRRKRNTTENMSKSPLEAKNKLKMNLNGTIVNYDKYFGDFPYVCNGSKIAEDPDKSYGYFFRNVHTKAPISTVNVSGNTWIQHGDMLALNVKCLGSKEIKYCVTFHEGSYNVTGNETCSYYQELENCNFGIKHYFKETTLHTIVFIIKNDVSKHVQSIAVHIYKVNKQAQLSVIVVPVASSIVAVVLVIFGVAYYIQNRSRFIVEVADFNFSQQYNDLEYKTFRERLRDSITNAFVRAPSPTNSEAPSWPPGSRKYGSMT